MEQSSTVDLKKGERIVVEGVLRRWKNRKRRTSNWLVEFRNLLLEQTGLKKVEYYRERACVRDNHRVNKWGRKQVLFEFGSAGYLPKFLQNVPDGSVIKVSGIVEPWENTLGGTLRRARLLEVLPPEEDVSQ